MRPIIITVVYLDPFSLFPFFFCLQYLLAGAPYHHHCGVPGPFFPFSPVYNTFLQVRPIIITVVYLDQSPRQVRIGLTLPVEADVKDLRESLAKDTGIPTAQLLIAEINDVTFQRTLNDGQV